MVDLGDRPCRTCGRKQQMVNRRETLAALAAGTASALGAPAFAAPSKDEKRAEVRKMAQETLGKLYSVQPSAKKAIESSAGYAVFSNFGMKILVAGGGSGDGVAVNTCLLYTSP